MDKEKMTDEELIENNEEHSSDKLRNELADLFREFHCMMNQIPPPESMGKYIYWVNKAHALVLEAGYKSPEEVQGMFWENTGLPEYNKVIK